jgi:C-terminal processing protease CtpA/Prc
MNASLHVSLTRFFKLTGIIAAAAGALAASQSFAAPAPAPGDTTLADDLIGNLYVMRSVYKAEYAPADWKKKYANYDLDTEFNKALAAIQANPNLTLAQSRIILKNFIYAMKDYHTSISFVSTEAASLPIFIKGTDSKFYIVYIDRTKLPESAFPYHIGDEVVSFGGQATKDAVAAVQAEVPAAIPSTDKALAELYLTHRTGARGYVIPQGPISLEILPAGAKATQTVQMIWDYTPEKIDPRGTVSRGPNPFPVLPPLNDDVTEVAPTKADKVKIFRPMMNVKLNVKLDDGGAPVTPTPNPYDLGGKKSFTPTLGTQIWKSADGDVFDAYIYKEAGGKLVGYIRIPQYEVDGIPTDTATNTPYQRAIAEFARDVALFESTTDSLVIDQVNNPGGSVFYLYGLASMLATQPMQTALHRMSITQADAQAALVQIQQLASVKTDADAQKLITPDQTDGFPVGYEFARFTLDYDRFIVNQWNNGRKLTDAYWIGGVDQINPAETHYTKPILLLINNLDFSGGDFFPALMQDNKRVTIMGSRTSGAGGYVNDVPVPNNVGINAFRCTESIAERVNLNPIENLGVTPDVPYTMTENDFANNYADYVKAIKAEIVSLTK